MTDAGDLTTRIRRISDRKHDAGGPIIKQLSNRLHNLAGLNGLVISTLIGTLGANPRKGITATTDDLTDCLIDVAIEALTAHHQAERIQTTRVGAGLALTGKLERVAERAGAAPVRVDDPFRHGWICLLAISMWVDKGNAHRDQEAQLWGRVSKLAEEIGEASDALLAIGDGSDYQPGQWDTLREELLDIAVAALGAAEHVNQNTGDIRERLLEAAAEQAGVGQQITGEELHAALTAPRCGFTHTVYPARSGRGS